MKPIISRQISVSFTLTVTAVLSVWLSLSVYAPGKAFAITGLLILWLLTSLSPYVAFWFWVPSVVSITLVFAYLKYDKFEIEDNLTQVLWLLGSLIAVASASFAYRRLKLSLQKQEDTSDSPKHFFLASMQGGFLVGLTLVPSALIGRSLFLEDSADFDSLLNWLVIVSLVMPLGVAFLGALVGVFGAMVVYFVRQKQLEEDEVFRLHLSNAVSESGLRNLERRIQPPDVRG